jgi:hypothetical protein
MRNRPTLKPAQLARRPIAKHRLLAGVTVLAIVGGSTGAALAAAPYTLTLKVPSLINVSSRFKVMATGTSSNVSHLTVFLASKRCAASAKAEAALSSREIISKNVTHTYSKSTTVLAGSTGVYRACGYLTSPAPRKSARAHASRTYTVLAGYY